MSSLLYYSISSDLTEDEKIKIDNQVDKNREEVFLFVTELRSNSKRKLKRLCIVVVLVGGLCLSDVQPSSAMGLSVPVAPVERFYPSYQHPVELRIGRMIPRKADRIFYKSNKEILFLIFLTDSQISSNEQLLQMVNELRGGSWYGVLGNAAFFAIIYFITILSGEGFLLPPQNPVWVLPNGLYDPPGLVRPDSCMTKLDAGSPTQSLKTWNDRNQPNRKDRYFLVESRPELVMRRGQAKFKTKDHGALAGLPFHITPKGATSTLKSSANVDHFMDVVEAIVYDPNSTWFEEGTYQGNTDRKEEVIYVYSKRHKRLAVFLRSTGEFITFCEPTEFEIRDLYKNKNFGGQSDWFSGKPKNLPPNQEFNFDFTPEHTFESDVMKITYGSSMDKKGSPKEDFTPLNSFETDILEITPIGPD